MAGLLVISAQVLIVFKAGLVGLSASFFASVDDSEVPGKDVCCRDVSFSGVLVSEFPGNVLTVKGCPFNDGASVSFAEIGLSGDELRRDFSENNESTELLMVLFPLDVALA